jgi:hypothetical protein
MNSGRDVIVTLSAKMQDLPHFFQGTCFVDWVLCQKPWRSVRTFVRLRFFSLARHSVAIATQKNASALGMLRIGVRLRYVDEFWTDSRRQILDKNHQTSSNIHAGNCIVYGYVWFIVNMVCPWLLVRTC